MNTQITLEQSSNAIRMLREFGDHHSAAIIGSLAAQVKALKNDAAFFKDATAKIYTDLAFAENERDALKADADRFIHLARALSDLNALEAFEDAFHGADMPDCNTVDEVRERTDAAMAVKP